MTLSPLGDSAIVLALGEVVDDAVLARVATLAAEIERHRPKGVTDVVPAFASVTVFYDIARVAGFAELCAELEALATRADAAVVGAEPRLVEIPVCYGGEFGPDLENVAAHAGLTCEEVVALHRGADYRVQAIGFSPGFAYLGGLPEKIHAPRRATPRTKVPIGSVGIGGSQTGVYPLATPGGWNLIGRTPRRMFDPARATPALLRAGDRVTFHPIEPAEFESAAPEFQLERDPAQPASGLEVLRAGMATLVQDRGRTGHRASGVPLSGAMDPFALRVANLLVGNAEDAAALEFALVGPDLRFACDTIVALGGALFGQLPTWKPMRIFAGTTLKLRAARRGCRGYLAIAGGIDLPPVLGSRSTYTRAALGGCEGRALREGDVLPVGEVVRELVGHWYIDPRILPEYSAAPVVRVVPGAQAAEFGGAFFSARYELTTQGDRMGLRLRGPELRRAGSGDLVSATVVPGTIQVPPDGQPIVLMADAQTIGGYPQIAHVIAADLPLVAQLRPGDAVRFRAVTLAEAHQLALTREHALAMLREGVAQKFRPT
ncbi:MAG TPA: 5-oxoprolinase subunit PxpB [Opitutaceae bacterium]|nr:5-oxoprolinase subunit PxpB [Opitutaceae bacterium]